MQFGVAYQAVVEPPLNPAFLQTPTEDAAGPLVSTSWPLHLTLGRDEQQPAALAFLHVSVSCRWPSEKKVSISVETKRASCLESGLCWERKRKTDQTRHQQFVWVNDSKDRST